MKRKKASKGDKGRFRAEASQTHKRNVRVPRGGWRL